MVAVFGLAGGIFNALTGGPVNWDAVEITAGIVALGLALFQFGRRFAFVRVLTATPETLRLSFTSAQYALLFESANASLLVK